MSTTNQQPASTPAVQTAITPTSKAKAQIQGSLDGTSNNQAVGWAYNADTPKKRLMVEIVTEGRVVAYGLADQFRPDLAKAKIGDGHHRFLLNLSYEILDEKPHTLTARDADTGIIFGSFKLKPEKSPYEFYLITRSESEEIFNTLLKHSDFNKIDKKLDLVKKLYKQATLAQETGRLEEAEKTWALINKEMGETALSNYKLGEINLLKKNYKQALLNFNNSINLNKNLDIAILGVANTHYLLKNTDEAIKSLNLALERFPNNQDIANKINKMNKENLEKKILKLISSEKHSEAVQLLKVELMKTPNDKFTLDTLGNILISKVNIPETKNKNTIKDFIKSQLILDLIINEASK